MRLFTTNVSNGTQISFGLARDISWYSLLHVPDYSWHSDYFVFSDSIVFLCSRCSAPLKPLSICGCIFSPTQIQDIISMSHLLTVFRVCEDNHGDVDVAILQALLKGGDFTCHASAQNCISLHCSLAFTWPNKKYPLPNRTAVIFSKTETVIFFSKCFLPTLVFLLIKTD